MPLCSCLIVKDHLLQWSALMSRKSRKGSRKPAWMNKLLLTKLSNKGNAYKTQEQRQVTQEENRGTGQACRHRPWNAKAHQELNLSRFMKGNEKCFHTYLSRKRRTRENVSRLLNMARIPVAKDTGKTCCTQCPLCVSPYRIHLWTAQRIRRSLRMPLFHCCPMEGGLAESTLRSWPHLCAGHLYEVEKCRRFHNLAPRSSTSKNSLLTLHWDDEYEWKGPFYFIQGADPQFGLIKSWAVGDTNNGDDEWKEEIKLTEQAVQAVNKLNPKPKFFVLCGDLIHGMPGSQWRKDQERDLKNVLKNTDQNIPLVFVSGNHDIGNAPTRETIDNYCKSWGDDYFSFWVGGVFFLVLNSQLYFDSSKCPELKQAQDVWLNEQLAVAEKHKCKHIIVFQHIPLFLREPDEDHDYFNLEKSVRQEIMEKFHKAGIKAVFSGHYHRNAGGSYRGLEMVVTSAIGCQLGEDTHGLRVVVVTDEKIVHRYYSLDELSSQGMEKELLDMLAKQI